MRRRSGITKMSPNQLSTSGKYFQGALSTTRRSQARFNRFTFRLNGYYYGVDTLVPWSEWTPEEAQQDMYEAMPYTKPHGSAPLPEQHSSQQPAEAEQRHEQQISRRDPDPTTSLPLMPQLYNPYPDYKSDQYLSEFHHVEPCFLDVNDTQVPPDIAVYPGVGQHATLPFFGSYEELGLRQDVCFDRIGRYGPYGYAYGAEDGGLGIGIASERRGAHDVWNLLQHRQNWTSINWGAAQDRCLEKNQHRFNTSEEAQATKRALIKKKVPRTAFVFRTWTGYEYTPHAILTLRSTINELAIKSGGEYHVYLLLHVRDDSIPIWASDEVAQKVIRDNVPEEFWGITALWSVQQMRMYYPGPFEQTFENPSGADIHEVYRGNHFPLQWFSATHPEYDFVWNWEMDMRYSGHHYEFHNRVGEWAKAQPRRGLWERNQKLWIPSYHGNWTNFTNFVDEETIQNGEVPVWGPVSFPTEHKLDSPPETKPPTSWLKDNFEWGVGEEADLITFDPIFDPGRSNWVFRDDITGFSLALPIPPRRCAIVTVSRLSRRLLDIMHKETYSEKHSAFPEMWPPTVALHHGLKAVYIPHPVYFDRKWPLQYLDKTFNYPDTQWESVYGWGEHNFIGSTFYFNAGFAGALWRRWLGQRENDEGGHVDEINGSGRMCFRSILFHPVKKENFPD